MAGQIARPCPTPRTSKRRVYRRRVVLRAVALFTIFFAAFLSVRTVGATREPRTAFFDGVRAARGGAAERLFGFGAADLRLTGTALAVFFPFAAAAWRGTRRTLAVREGAAGFFRARRTR
jgi:hypothetical protein